MGVETGACPHTAIRDDVTANLMAVEDLEQRFAPLDVVLVESGGDNLTATFSPALVDVQIFVLDVAGGGDVARKGGPGIERADLLVVNKTDLAPYVGVDLARMVHDAEHARDGPSGAGAVPDRPGVGGGPGRLGPAPAGALPVRRPGARRPRPDGRPMLTRTRTEVRSSHLRAFRCLGPARSGGAGAGAGGPARRATTSPSRSAWAPAARWRSWSRAAPSPTRCGAVGPLGRAPSRWTPAGRLVWHGEPFVVAEGADVQRTPSVELAAGASVVLRETLVLGRSGEAPGRLRSRTEVRREGAPVLLEELDARVGMGPHRVLDQVLHLGAPVRGRRAHAWCSSPATCSAAGWVQRPTPARCGRQSSASPE